MMYVSSVLTVLFWAVISLSPVHAAEPAAAPGCECPKLACDVCSVERGVTFYSEKCGGQKAKVKSCSRPTCVPIDQATAACPVPPKAGSPPSEPVVVTPAVKTSTVSGGDLPQSPAIGHVRVIQGSVSIVHSDGQKTLVNQNAALLEKETVESAKDGKAVIEFEGGNKLHVHPDTAVEVGEFTNQALESRKALLNLIKGKIRNQVNQKYTGKSSYYRVKTKAVVAGVRGTDFIIENHEDGSVETKIETLEGKVVLADLLDESKSREISRGEGARFLSDAPGQPGTLSQVYQLSPEALLKLDVDSSVELAKAAKPKPKPEVPICSKPRGMFNQCAWSLGAAGECIRSRCNANGAWADTTTLPAATSQGLCPPSGYTVKDCDY